MFNKKQIIEKIIEELDREKNTLVAAALEAKEAATNEESKAENKYDTRGLEASYLANAQAKRAQEIIEMLNYLEQIEIREYDNKTPIEATALVEVAVDGEEQKYFFIVPQQGGMMINLDASTVFTISPDSPLGKNLYQKKQGDYFELKINGAAKEYEIIKVY